VTGPFLEWCPVVGADPLIDGLLQLRQAGELPVTQAGDDHGGDMAHGVFDRGLFFRAPDPPGSTAAE